MPVISEARARASRINGQMSRGPKTPEGKAISRANSLKHGLTGEGVVIPDGDVEAINIRIGNLEAQLKPRTEMGTVLVGRIAVLTVRLDRCTEQAADVVAARIKKALRDFDDDRLDQADALFDGLAESPSANLRKLERTGEGLRRLIVGYTELRVALLAGHWRTAHGTRLAHLQGSRADDCGVSHLIELSEAVQGRSGMAQPAQASQGDASLRIEQARTRLTAFLDDEIASLELTLEALDPTDLDEARAEAIDAARLEAAPAVHQIQRYEAATERSLFRTIKEARLVESAPTLADQAKVTRPRVATPNPVEEKVSAPLGSFSQTSDRSESDLAEPALTDLEMPSIDAESHPTADDRDQVDAKIQKAGLSLPASTPTR